MLETEYKIQRLNDANRSDLAYLYLDAFGENRSPAYTQMKFDTGYTGVKDLAYFAYDTDNKPAAFYALFPVFMNYNGRKIIAAQVGDLMTHSKHRRKGLYLKLAHICHEQAITEGVELIYTIPYGENASYQGFVNHLGFQKIYSLREYILTIPSPPLASIAHKIPALKPVYHGYSKLVLNLFHRLPAFSKKAADKNEVIKDEAFFRYKKYSETYILQIAGAEVWLKFKGAILMVGDMNKVTKNNIAEVLQGLRRMAFVLGIRAIRFDVAPGSPVDECLSLKINSTAATYNALTKNLTAAAFENLYFTSGDLDNF